MEDGEVVEVMNMSTMRFTGSEAPASLGDAQSPFPGGTELASSWIHCTTRLHPTAWLLFLLF